MGKLNSAAFFQTEPFSRTLQGFCLGSLLGLFLRISSGFETPPANDLGSAFFSFLTGIHIYGRNIT